MFILTERAKNSFFLEWFIFCKRLFPPTLFSFLFWNKKLLLEYKIFPTLNSFFNIILSTLITLLSVRLSISCYYFSRFPFLDNIYFHQHNSNFIQKICVFFNSYQIKTIIPFGFPNLFISNKIVCRMNHMSFS